MPRPPKERPNHGDLYEVKINFADKGAPPDRRSFYSPISKEDARQKGMEAKAQYLARQTMGLPETKSSCTFRDWSLRWLESTKKNNVKDYTYQTTYKSKLEKYLIPYFGDYQLRQIKLITIQDFFNAHSELSDSMLKKFRLILISIFDLAIENDLLYKNPVKRVKIMEKRKEERRTYTRGQYEKLLTECIARNHLDIVLLLKTGIRRSELLGLQWKDINTRGRFIHINSAITPGAGSPVEAAPKSEAGNRFIPIDDELAELLEANRAEGYFVTGTNRFMSPSGYAKHYRIIMEPMCNSLGIPALTPHELRHTFGTLLRERGADIYTIQKAMGHSDIGITAKIYVHNDLEVLRRNMGITTKEAEKKSTDANK